MDCTSRHQRNRVDHSERGHLIPALHSGVGFKVAVHSRDRGADQQATFVNLLHSQSQHVAIKSHKPLKFVLQSSQSLFFRTFNMSLCKVCDSIDVGAGGVGSMHPQSVLGPYPELVSRAKEGCEGCQFFCKILESSLGWKDKLDELNDRIVVFSGLRLDVRKKDELAGRSWSCDDLLFDVCVGEGCLGM